MQQPATAALRVRRQKIPENGTARCVLSIRALRSCGARKDEDMRRFFGMTMALASTLLFNGCAMEQADETEQSDDELIFGDYPSTVTFYENANFTGAQLAVQIQPNGSLNEIVDLIPRGEIEAAGLLSKISSVRLQCGNRASRVVLFRAHNTATNFGSWITGSAVRPLDCEPNETVSVNLHTEAPLLANLVGSAYFVRHANKVVWHEFSTEVRDGWIQAMQTELPSGASADGEPQLKLTSGARFTLRQDLVLDDLLCGEHSANLNLAARLYQDRHFEVTVLSTYVDTGFGDFLGCRDKMQKKLADAALTGAETFENALDQLFALQMPVAQPRYYFAPSWGVEEFDIFGGGKSSGGIVVF
jgi:hypothetical protein